MLYLYNEKTYIKPFINKIVEVEIKKDIQGNFDVIATRNVIADENIISKITSISIEDAYNLSQKKKKKRKIKED